VGSGHSSAAWRFTLTVDPVTGIVARGASPVVNGSSPAVDRSWTRRMNRSWHGAVPYHYLHVSRSSGLPQIVPIALVARIVQT